MLITFSGLDGSGKTTQIDLIVDFLKNKKNKVKRLTLYDNISSAAFFRKHLLNKIFKTKSKGKQDINSSKGKFRMDENRKDCGLVFMRQIAYLLDLVIFLFLRYYYERKKGEILILDRYLYDSLANLADTNRLAKIYIKAFLPLIPKPDIAFLLDVRPEEAFLRKPEYSLKYNRQREKAYLDFFEKLKTSYIVKSNGIMEIQREIKEVVERKL